MSACSIIEANMPSLFELNKDNFGHGKALTFVSMCFAQYSSCAKAWDLDKHSV